MSTLEIERPVPPVRDAPAEPSVAAVLRYDGETRAVLRLWLVTVLLSIVTLSFYRFWGKARLRRYIWSHMAVAGDRLEYDGTGGELFVQFLKAVGVLAPILLAPVLLTLGGFPTAAKAVQVLLYILLAPLGLLAIYTGRRYRYSRTIWRGMRARLEGHALTYALSGLGQGLLTVVTLGLYRPWMIVDLWSYEMNHLRIGDAKVSFDGSGRALFRVFLMSWLGVGVCFLALAALVWQIGRLVLQLAVGAGVQSATTIVAIILAGYAIVLIGAWFSRLVAFVDFERSWLAYRCARTGFMTLAFSSNAGWRDVFRLRLGNALILIATLGTGGAIVQHRTFRFLARHVAISGAAALDGLTGDPARERSRGEGIGEFIGEGLFG